MMVRFALVLVMMVGSVAAQTPKSAPSAAVGADKPLPAIGPLLLEVEKNQDAAEKMQRDYTYHVHAEQQELDGKGNVKKTTMTDSESVTISGVRVDRVVARDGKPLTPEEAKKESDKIDKEVARDKERRAKAESNGKSTDAEGHDELSVSRILQLGTFSNPRRVTLNDRPTIVADYAGDPNAKTKNRFETMFRDLVGTVWIDEQDRALVQVQGHFLNDFKIGGGLIADVKKDSSFSAKMTKVNGEAWLPEEITGQGKIRVLLFAGFSGRVKLVTSDYRKFRASATIVGGGQQVGDDGKPVPETAPQPDKQKP
jgi:hypothetical protein